MSVSNILNTGNGFQPINPIYTTGSIPTLTQVLTAGNSAGDGSIIELMSITGPITNPLQISSGFVIDIITVDGSINASNDFSISAGNNIALSGTTTSIQSDSYTTIYGLTKIEPPSGYTYNYAPVIPLHITNWNPPPIGITQMTGVEVSQMYNSDGNSTGIDIVGITASANYNARGISIESIISVAPGSGSADSIYIDRGAKSALDNGFSIRLLNGSLCLGEPQLLTNTNTEITPDGGNFVIILASAPTDITLQAPPYGFQNGQFYYITKNHNGNHNVNIVAPYQFNAQVAGTPYSYGGTAFNSLIMFYSNNVWYVNQL
jgi:hypothetical protein